MMKRSFRDAWTAKLRSGEYRQARTVLAEAHDYQCRCCLGVAYDVRGDVIPFNETGITKFARLPNLFDMDNWGISYHEARTLASMNDNEGCTFAEIADYIDTLEVEEG